MSSPKGSPVDPVALLRILRASGLSEKAEWTLVVDGQCRALAIDVLNAMARIGQGHGPEDEAVPAPTRQELESMFGGRQQPFSSSPADLEDLDTPTIIRLRRMGQPPPPAEASCDE